MKKKSTIFAIIAILCIAAAMFFLKSETADFYEDLIPDDPEEEETKPRARRNKKDVPPESDLELIPDIKPETNGTGSETPS